MLIKLYSGVGKWAIMNGVCAVLGNVFNYEKINQKMTEARKYLETALGGNMNIGTLTPLSFSKIMQDFANKKVKEAVDKIDTSGFKQLELTVKKNGNRNIKAAYFDLTLVIDKSNRLSIYNTKADGDWREDVDCDTLIVEEIKLRV